MAFTDYSDIEGAGFVAGAMHTAIVGATPITYINDGTVVLPAGFGAVLSAEGKVTLPSGAGTFAGVVTLPQSLEKRTGYSLDTDGFYGYPVDYEAALANDDWYAVYVDDAVAAGDPVYLNHTASTSKVGTFRNDANTANAQLISGARFEIGAVGTPTTPAIAIVNFSA